MSATNLIQVSPSDATWPELNPKVEGRLDVLQQPEKGIDMVWIVLLMLLIQVPLLVSLSMTNCIQHAGKGMGCLTPFAVPFAIVVDFEQVRVNTVWGCTRL